MKLLAVCDVIRLERINRLYTVTSNVFERTSLMVEDIGVEPMTPCVQGRCSSQLS